MVTNNAMCAKFSEFSHVNHLENVKRKRNWVCCRGTKGPRKWLPEQTPKQYGLDMKGLEATCSGVNLVVNPYQPYCNLH